MYGKVFKIGYTKRKKIPVLFHEKDSESSWGYAFMLFSHVFDATMRQCPENIHLSTLLIFSKCEYTNQRSEQEKVCKAYYEKSKITLSGKFFIPVKKIHWWNYFIKGVPFDEWETSRMADKPVNPQPVT